MKTMFKKLFAVLGLAAIVALNVQAAQLTATYNLAATNNIIATNGIAIHKITIANTGTNALFIKFFDSPNANLTYSSATGYTNYVNQEVTWEQVFTNYTGVVETNTITVVTNVPNVSPGFTNSYPVILALTVPTNTTTVWTPALYKYAFQGLTTTNITCGASSTVTIDYSPFK